MNLANASPVILQLCDVGCDIASLPTMDVSIPEIHSVCSMENAGDLKIKHWREPKQHGIRKTWGFCFDLWLQGAGHSAKPGVVFSVTGWEMSPALGGDSTFRGLAAASLS